MNALAVQIRPDLVDRLIDLYCDWRTASGEVQILYDCFREAPATERAVAFAAYAAALDREEATCQAYAAQIRLIESRCAGAGVLARQRQRPRA